MKGKVMTEEQLKKRAEVAADAAAQASSHIYDSVYWSTYWKTYWMTYYDYVYPDPSDAFAERVEPDEAEKHAEADFGDDEPAEVGVVDENRERLDDDWG